MERMHRLIKFKRTGPPDTFAEKLEISVSMLYRLMGDLKELGAPIEYSSFRQSYQYKQPTELRLGFYSPTLDTEQLRATNGGEAIVRKLDYLK